MNLEQWRKIQGLTNNRLADMVGVNKSTISRLRRGVTKPSPDTAKAIVELTDGAVTLGDLYGGNLRKKERHELQNAPRRSAAGEKSRDRRRRAAGA
jgi:Helix-turn-helix.